MPRVRVDGDKPVSRYLSRFRHEKIVDERIALLATVDGLLAGPWPTSPATDPEMPFANHRGLSGTSEVVTLKLLKPYLASRSSTALGVRDSFAPGPQTTSAIGSSLPSFGRSST